MVAPWPRRGHQKGTKYHAKNPLPSIAGDQLRWVFETKQVPLEPFEMLMARVSIARIKDVKRLDAILRAVPVVLDSDSWNCVYWVQDALIQLESCSTERVLKPGALLAWDEVREVALQYVQSKTDEHRYDGKLEEYRTMQKVPEYDAPGKKELVR